MKTSLLYLLLTILPAGMLLGNDDNPGKMNNITPVQEKDIIIKTGSSLFIKGTSNVNTFVCDYDSGMLRETKKVRYTKNGATISLRGALLKLQNFGFDCGNKGINKDFHELLKTNKYPHILLDIKEIFPQGKGLAAAVTIEIAGVKRSYNVIVSKEGSNTFDGLLCVNIRDFNLTPPKKMMGLIVVHEEIEINFNLDMDFRD